MIALVSYQWRTTVASYRWVAPSLVGAATIAVLSADSGRVVASYAGVAVAVLFLSLWLSVVVGNAEDPQLVAVTSTSAGGFARVRLASLAVAYLGALALTALGLLGPALGSPGAVTVSQLATGLVACLTTALAGVCIGGLLTRPILGRTAWAVVIGAVVALLDLVVPHGPPTRQLLVLLNAPHALATNLLLIAAETLAMAAILVVLSIRLAWARS